MNNGILRGTGRIRFPGIIEAELAIESVGGCCVSSGRAGVEVTQLGLDRLKFASAFRFPISGGYRLSFAFELYDRPYKLSGYVTGRSEGDGRYIYTVRLFVPDETRNGLRAALEQRSLAVRSVKEQVHSRYREHAAQARRPRRRSGAEAR